jgi:hypothetical protein
MAKTPSKQSAKKAAPAKKVRESQEIGRFNNSIILNCFRRLLIIFGVCHH